MKNRKTFLLTILCLGCSSLLSAQVLDSTRIFRSYVTLRNSPPIPLGGVGFVSGKLIISSDSLCFQPKPCGPPNYLGETISTCINDLVQPVELSFDEIKQIRRRNFLFVFPNRIRVTKLSGHSYIFFTYHRGVIIRTFKAHQAAQYQAVVTKR
jgi:hypothetical protein